MQTHDEHPPPPPTTVGGRPLAPADSLLLQIAQSTCSEQRQSSLTRGLMDCGCGDEIQPRATEKYVPRLRGKLLNSADSVSTDILIIRQQRKDFLSVFFLSSVFSFSKFSCWSFFNSLRYMK